jgi:hypothetical protein
LKDWNSYLKNIYVSSIFVGNTPNVSIEDESFSIEYINFGFKRLMEGKGKDIEIYQAKIIKIKVLIPIPCIQKLFNLLVKKGFPKPWTQSPIVHVFKICHKSSPSNYRTIMISPLLSKIYISVFENNINMWLEIHGKGAKRQVVFRGYHSTMDHIVTLRIIGEEGLNNKTNNLYCFIDFRNSFDIVPKNNLWNRLEEIKVPLELRATIVRLYKSVISKFRNN